MTGKHAPSSQPTSIVPFAFKNHPIRTVIDGDGAPWFVAKDTAAALGLKWHGKILSCVPDQWLSMRKVLTDSRGARDTTIISEPAVYKLAFRSNKPEADEFTNWVASEVLPAIRKTGKFVANLPHGPITPGQQQELQNIVAAKASAYPQEATGRIRAQVWSRLHNKFKVAKYNQIPSEKFPEAVEYLLRLEVRAELPKPEPEALPAPEGPDLHALAVTNTRNYRPELRTIEDAIVAATMQLRTIQDAVLRASHAADGSNVTIDTSLAQKSAELVCSRAETIRSELRELEGMALLGLAGIATHLELKQTRTALRQIERDSKGRYKAPESLRHYR